MRRLSRCPLSCRCVTSRHARQLLTRMKSDIAEVDSTGIPIKPTWSVNELLSSYLRPTISPSTLTRLHELSALIPPTNGTLEHAELTREMEELVKLVEAVRLVDVGKSVEESTVPDGRIWASGEGVSLDADAFAASENSGGVGGRALLAHASRTVEGLYIVETDRPRS